MNTIELPFREATEPDALDWEGRLHQRLLAGLSFTPEEDRWATARYFSNSCLSFQDAQLTLNYGIFNDDYPQPARKRQFILDIDASSSKDLTPANLLLFGSRRTTDLFSRTLSERLDHNCAHSWSPHKMGEGAEKPRNEVTPTAGDGGHLGAQLLGQEARRPRRSKLCYCGQPTRSPREARQPNPRLMLPPMEQIALIGARSGRGSQQGQKSEDSPRREPPREPSLPRRYLSKPRVLRMGARRSKGILKSRPSPSPWR